MKLLVLAALLVASTPLAHPTPSSDRSADFQLTLTPTAKGWSARCAKGCTWRSVAVECRNVCDVVIDDFGMRTLATRFDETPTFAFTVHREARGVVAMGRVGLAWEEAAWGCPTAGCTITIDALGGAVAVPQ